MTKRTRKEHNGNCMCDSSEWDMCPDRVLDAREHARDDGTGFWLIWLSVSIIAVVLVTLGVTVLILRAVTG